MMVPLPCRHRIIVTSCIVHHLRRRLSRFHPWAILAPAEPRLALGRSRLRSRMSQRHRDKKKASPRRPCHRLSSQHPSSKGQRYLSSRYYNWSWSFRRTHANQKEQAEQFAHTNRAIDVLVAGQQQQQAINANVQRRLNVHGRLQARHHQEFQQFKAKVSRHLGASFDEQA